MHHAVAVWGYPALLLLTVISSAGIPIGAEFAIGFSGAVAGGALVAHEHLHFSLALVIAVATTGELIGSLIGYTIARHGGRALVARFGRYLLISERDLDRAEHYFDRYGPAIVVLGRLVPIIRSFVSFGPGIAKMPVRRFALFSVLGCAIWCGSLASVGYLLGQHWHHWFSGLQNVGYGVLGVIVLALVAGIVIRIHALRRERALTEMGA